MRWLLWYCVCAAALIACDDGGGSGGAAGRDGGGHDAAPPAQDAAPPAGDGTPPAQDAARHPDAAPPPGGELRINEIVAAGGGDWFELTVVGDEPVNLADHAVIDDANNRSPRFLPALTLAPGELVVIAAVAEAPADGSPWVDFRLGADDALTLLRGDAVVDRVDWADGDAPAGASYGRLPDGDGEWQTTRPTPGAPNEAFDGLPPPADPFVTDRVVEVRVELPPEAWRAMLAAPLDEAYQRANIVYDGVRADDVAIRTKGNSSLRSVVQQGSDRFSFKVDVNYYVNGQELLGVKKLNFNNGFKDPTLLREHLGYTIARDLGLPTPRTAFADLWIGDEHMGLYTVVEQVDGAFLRDRFDDDNGVLYKLERQAGSLGWQGEDPEAYDGLNTERNGGMTDHAAFIALVRALNEGDPDTFPSVVEVDLALAYLALNTVLANLDSYSGSGHNYYLYDRAGVFTFIPWDLNEAFGNFTCGCDRAALIDFLIDEPVCGPLDDRPLAARLLAVPALLDQYHQTLRSLIDGPFSEDEMRSRIEVAADLIRPWVQSDTRKLFTTEEFERALADDVRGAIGLAAFVRERGASIRAQLAGERPSTDEGGGNCGGVGPGPGPGPRSCGDGVCDEHEQANPNLCPQDC